MQISYEEQLKACNGKGFSRGLEPSIENILVSMYTNTGTMLIAFLLHITYS